jgi:hypothetical protein
MGGNAAVMGGNGKSYSAGSPGAPGSPGGLQDWSLGAEIGFTSWDLLFSQMGPRWAGSGSGSEPWGHQPTPWPTAAPGGEKREGGALHRPY